MRFLLCFSVIGLFTSAAIGQTPQGQEPSEEHKVLQKDVGNWTGTMKMPGPDGQQTELPISETNSSFGSGLWMLREFAAGPFQGRGQYGYDTKKKKYIGTWIDNTSPFMSVMEGEYDEAEDSLVMRMEGVDAATGETHVMKSVDTREGEKKRHFIMYAKDGDTWQKAFEIHYEREK